MPAQRVATTRVKMTAAEILCIISSKFERDPTEETMAALVKRYQTGDRKIDRVVLGYARDTLAQLEEKRSRR